MGYMEINPFKDEDNYLLKRGLPRSDYVRGSEECGGCNEQYDFLIAVESVSCYDQVPICFHCCVHRHGMDISLSIYDRLDKFEQFRWENKSNEEQTINDKKQE